MKHTAELRSLKMTLVLYLVIFAMKLAVYLVSGVMALFAEALHTLADIFVSGFLLIATLYSRRRADSEHMFGHGRAQNVAALVAATLFISFTSFELYKEAIPRLFRVEEKAYQNLNLVLIVLGISILLAAVPLIRLSLQKGRGAAAKAQFIELINDELGLLAALVGTLFIQSGLTIADPIAAIIVATIITINAVGLFRENLSYLIGRAPHTELLDQVRSTVLTVPGILGVHKVRGEYVGPDHLLVELHVTVRRGMLVEEADALSETVLAKVYQVIKTGYCVVHVDAGKKSV